MAEGASPEQGESIVVTTRDGRIFHCRRAHFRFKTGVSTETELRWVFSDGHGFDHVGPIVIVPLAVDALTLLVEDWWDMKKALDRTWPQRTREE